jgi:hypothetical protein
MKRKEAMLPEPAFVQVRGDSVDVRFDHVDEDTIARELRVFLDDRGYELESGTPTRGIYGSGSRHSAVFFGVALARRSEMFVVVTGSESGESVLVHIEKGTTGPMAATLDHRRTNRDFDSIVSDLSSRVGADL